MSDAIQAEIAQARAVAVGLAHSLHRIAEEVRDRLEAGDTPTGDVVSGTARELTERLAVLDFLTRLAKEQPK